MSAEMDLILEKLNNLDTKLDTSNKMSQENNRSLRGFNNTPGLVANMRAVQVDVKFIREEKMPECGESFTEIKKTLHGEGEGKIGVVGEVVLLKRIGKWILGLMTGAIGAIIGLAVKVFIFGG